MCVWPRLHLETSPEASAIAVFLNVVNLVPLKPKCAHMGAVVFGFSAKSIKTEIMLVEY